MRGRLRVAVAGVAVAGVAVAGVAVVVAACSPSPRSTTPPSPAESTGVAATTPASTTPASRPSMDWATYHGDLDRDGVAGAGPTGVTGIHAAWTAHVDGAVYGQPVAADGLVVVATERDVVAAFDGATGAKRWSITLGTPVPGDTLPCGDIDPSGITSTPVIDGGVVYAVAFLEPAHHELVALDASSGALLRRVPVDLPGLSPMVEQQRGALTVANGRVYVPYGGLYGDCGDYKGGVVGASLSDLAAQVVWTTTAAREAAVWAPPGPTVASDGSLYIATGNAGTGSVYDGGDAVVHLSPDLRQLDLFAPAEWRRDADDDLDLGSSSPVLVGSHVMQSGKTGTAYLLDPTHLGGVGGQVASVKACASTFGGAATDQAGATTYLPCVSGVVAVRVIGPTLSRLWSSPSFDAGGPVLVGGAVWVPDIGAGALVALDPQTGKVRSRTRVGRLAHFATVGYAAGHLVVATMDGTVAAYTG